MARPIFRKRTIARLVALLWLKAFLPACVMPAEEVATPTSLPSTPTEAPTLSPTEEPTSAPTESPTASPVPDRDADGFVAHEDCDDYNPLVYPGALEVCDGVDNNCNRQTDEGLTVLLFVDADGDGLGGKETENACPDADGFAESSGDCDDSNARVGPGAPEVCDEIDNDCDLLIDENVTTVFYLDQDLDGYGVYSSSTRACTCPEGYSPLSGDCNDLHPGTSPEAREICDRIDNDCDGSLDEGYPQTTYYPDEDKDGYGDVKRGTFSCMTLVGLITTGGDCNDQNMDIHPGATESCNKADDDCDGRIDDGLTTGTWFPDDDGDGFGAETGAVTDCQLPDGMVSSSNDCDDTAALVHPGAQELCDGLDNDCDGANDDGLAFRTLFPDRDGDGYGDQTEVQVTCLFPTGWIPVGADCDDTRKTVYPGALDTCDGLDNDCDGTFDEGYPHQPFYPDADGDGYGRSEGAKGLCVASQGWVSLEADCDDTEADTYPGAPDVKGDGIDSDCGGNDLKQPSVGLYASEVDSIQEALDQAVPGETVYVGPGAYAERNVSMGGRGLRLFGVGGPTMTVLEPQQLGRGLVFEEGEGPESEVVGFTIRQGTSSTVGGAIHIYYASPTLVNLVLEDSYAGEGGGGFDVNHGLPSLRDVTVRDCESQEGGGAYLWNRAQATLEHVTFEFNQAEEGGGLAVRNATGILSDVSFVENEATGMRGGGLLSDGGTLAISSARFLNNRAGGATYGGQGGGLALTSSVVTVVASWLEGNGLNGSSSKGGGLMVDGGEVALANTAFLSNSAEQGGGIAILSGSPSFTHSVVLFNAAGEGGGVWISGADSRPVFSNSILAYNDAYNAFVSQEVTGQPVFSYCDLYSSASDPNHNLEQDLDASNLSVDPQFYQYISGQPLLDLHLDTDSALIDRGRPTEKDPDGSICDIGLFGGESADQLDVDGDRVPDYYWRGAYFEAPSSADPESFDCDDRDPTWVECP